MASSASSTATPRRPRAPWLTLQVTKEIAEESVNRDSAHCMIAEAVKTAFPDARHVSVDVQTIRFTDPAKNLRYTYLTPRVAQVAIIQFDQGVLPDEFSVRLTGGHVTKANLKTRRKAGEVREGTAKQKAAWAKAAETARESAHMPLEPVLQDPQATAKPLPAGATMPERVELSDRGQALKGRVPDRVGGRTPPLVPGGRRRAFGLRAFDRAQ